MLVERWRPKTHTFHLPRDKCTITLKDVALQLSLSVDGLVVTRLAVIPGKEDLCLTYLGKAATTPSGFQIMRTTELGIGRVDQVVPKDVLVVGLVATTVSTSPSEPPIHVPIGDKDAKVSLTVYAMVEMHKLNQVMRQFGRRQQIPPPPRDIEELHKVNLQGKNDEVGQEVHKDYTDT
ncbi:hypothetical protein Gotri_027553 [Gossypium trilobum]|uniref:Aminotransferase-like plant mobile domain-containing protein n=1 Tax=Gossypium trilobum TaxID=34281 RepID=A0A7J9FY21_9ROSI|nr:hypothetical protein [Gossypium trilobum]